MVLAAMLMVLVVTLVATFSRGAMLTIAVGLVAWAFARSTRLGLASIGVIVMVAAIALPMYIETRLDLTLGPRTDPTESLTASDDSRTDAFGAGLRLFADAPILGVGFGQFSNASGEYLIGASTTYPHNSAVKVLAEQGVVGVTLAVTVLVLVGRSVYRSRHPLRNAAWATLIAYLVGSMTLEPFWSVQTSGLTALLIAAVLAPTDVDAGDRQPSAAGDG
jgi:O-antigen ligase